MRDKLVARDGDTLVVSYPELKLPLSTPRYAMVSIAGLTYSRKLLDGEDVQEQYTAIYEFLKENADRDGADKVKAWHAELNPEYAQDSRESLKQAPEVPQRQTFNARGPVPPKAVAK